MKFNKSIHWLLYPIFILACARQSTPTGGPKDTIPPVLLRSNPANEQLQFKGKSIELTFSELVALSNPKEQVIITPTIGKDYDIIARNNKVILSYETDLTDSTTYTFNFRDAVQDITEKNPARNLKLAVSTGTYIDSLSVQGTVYNLPEQNPVKDATVALQPYTDTFNIFKHAPTYFTKTDEEGVFRIDNLKPGLYTIFSVSDQNKNLIADSKNERYAFHSQPLQLDSVTKNIELDQVKLDARPLKLTSARPYNTYFNIRASKNLKHANITAPDSTFLNYTFGTDRANVQLYDSFGELDSLLLHIELEDSIQNKFDTTLYAKFTDRDVIPEKFETKLTSTSLITHKGVLKFEIQFSKPLKEIDFDSLFYQIDSTNTVTFNQQNLNYDPLNRILTVQKTFEATKFYKSEENNEDAEASLKQGGTQKRNQKMLNQLYIGQAAFISVEQDSSKRIKQRITPLRFEDLGMIIVQARVNSDKSIIQLLNTNKKIISSVRNKDKATFEDLLPDDYLLRIILDTNGNGFWDPGNYLTGTEPEKIIYYENENGDREIKLKANFEIGPLLITY
jgi:hypothetical protein